MNQSYARILTMLLSCIACHFSRAPFAVSCLQVASFPLPALSIVLFAATQTPTSVDPAAARDAFARHAMEKHGDKDRGRAIFTAGQGTNCTRCHRACGVGASIGPDLSNIGGKFARPHLVESILEPSRQ